MGKQILMPFEGKAKLKRLMKVSYPTIREALTFRSNTELANRIRQVAVKDFGGVESQN